MKKKLTLLTVLAMLIALMSVPFVVSAAGTGTITVNTGAISGCSIGVVQNGSWVVAPAAFAGNTASFTLADNGKDYEIRISKGGMGVYLNGKVGDTINATVKALTVNTGSLVGCSIGVVQNGSWVYSPATVAGNETSFNVFDNGKDYEVRIAKGGMGINLYGQAGATLTAQVKALTVNTAQITGCSIGIVQNGSWVYSPVAVAGNEKSFDVFDNGKDYEIRIAKGGMDITLNGKAGTKQTAPTYAIYNPKGLGSVGLVQNGSWVYQNIASPSTIYVFKNDKPAEFRYTIDGASRKDNITLNGVLASLTVDFTGLYYAPNTYLYNESGAQVGYSQSADKAVFTNLQAGNYTVKLLKNGLTKIYNVRIYFSDFDAVKTYTVPLVTLTVIQPGAVNYACSFGVIPVNGSGYIAYSQSNAYSVTGMKLFPDEPYKIYFSGGMNYTGNFTVGSDDYTYTVPVKNVTISTLGVKYGYGMNLFVTNDSNGATAQYRQVMANTETTVALIPGNSYTITLDVNGTILVKHITVGDSDMFVYMVDTPQVVNVYEVQGLAGLTNLGTVSDAKYNLTPVIGKGDIHFKPAFVFDRAVDLSKVVIKVIDGYNGIVYQQYTGSSWVSIGTNTYTHNNGPQIFEPAGDVKSGLNDKLKYEIYYDGKLVYTYTVNVYVP